MVGLQLRVSQGLALTPQLQQSIKLLQMSSVELSQEVRTMLELNPFLTEADEDDEIGEPELTLGAEASLEDPDSVDWLEGVEPQIVPDFDGADTSEISSASRDELADGDESWQQDWSSPGSAAGDDFEARDTDAATVTLQEHLLQQVAGLVCSAIERAALELVIYSLDERGYLIESVQELMHIGQPDLLEASEDEGVASDALAWATRLVQSLDPAGVGAGTWQECVLLQAKARAVSGLAPDDLVADFCAIFACPLEWLARKDFKRIARQIKRSEAAVGKLLDQLREFDVNPGRAFSMRERVEMVPEIIVRRLRSGYSVELNTSAFPRVGLNARYIELVKSPRGGEAKFATQVQDAKWFVKNLHQRADTILRVSSAIVEQQKAFFSLGARGMKPLVLRDIAGALSLHESTISRVTTGKYMATPMGTFELKYFFGSALGTHDGEETSSTAVRDLIKNYIASEDSERPLSDGQIAHKLVGQGIQCARRTVAKYRESLGIPVASLRR
jgi:RNA polymerase sigma-54 factor